MKMSWILKWTKLRKQKTQVAEQAAMYFWSLTYGILATMLSGKLLKHMGLVLCVLKMAHLISLCVGLFQVGKSCQRTI